jgi:tRNA(His) 5'-end guanylyltransferase
MSVKLKDRIDSYKELYNYKLLPKLPIIIPLNGKSFSKITSLLDKPYDSKLSECFLSTVLKLCSEIEGVIFASL